MNKSFLKFITDFGPLLIFFTIYYKSGKDLTTAIPPLIVATILAVATCLIVLSTLILVSAELLRRRSERLRGINR